MLLYHGTSAEYEGVDFARLGTDPGAVANCRMGLWVSPDPEVASRFGDRVLEIDATGAVAEDMSIDLLSRMHREGMRDTDGGAARHEAYAGARRAAGVGVILVRETDGSFGVGIVVDPALAATARPWETAPVPR